MPNVKSGWTEINLARLKGVRKKMAKTKGRQEEKDH
jgi:hypothetical protein